MGMVGGIVLIFWAIGFFNWRRKNSTDSVWVVLSLTGICGLVIGTTLSFVVGANFIPKKMILTETKVLKPLFINNEKVFVIKNERTQEFLYFVDGRSGNEYEGESRFFLENDISYKEKETNRIECYEESFRNPKLKYVFWGGTTTYSKLILSRRGDVF